MGKYICKVLPTETCNEDFAPDADLREGMEVDGYVLIGFKDGTAAFETIMGISMDKISKWIRKQSKGAKLIRAACTIAEGEIRAKEIMEEDEDQDVTMTIPIVPMDEKTIRKILGKERNGYSERDLHHHPEGRPLPAREKMAERRAELDVERIRRLENAEEERRGAGGRECRRGDGAV